MTIRQGKDKREAPPPFSRDNLSDQTVKIIIKNMTARNGRILRDFKRGRIHPLPCVCWLCVWRKFEKMRPVGPPYDYLTFLAYDILDEITSPFQYEPVKKMPIKKLAREVIRQLPIIDADTKTVLNKFARELFEAHFIEYAYKKRYRRDKLIDLIDRIYYKIHCDWKRTKPKPATIISLKRETPAELARKVARFVYHQPDHMATQRQLQRYTNKRKSDLEAIHEWLKWRYKIIVPPHKPWESTLYVGTQPVRLS
jgi:hypothetical protein